MKKVKYKYAITFSFALFISSIYSSDEGTLEPLQGFDASEFLTRLSTEDEAAIQQEIANIPGKELLMRYILVLKEYIIQVYQKRTTNTEDTTKD